MQPRRSRDAAETQPRGSREAAERQPRGSREAAKRQPRGSREAAERQPRGSRVESRLRQVPSVLFERLALHPPALEAWSTHMETGASPARRGGAAGRLARAPHLLLLLLLLASRLADPSGRGGGPLARSLGGALRRRDAAATSLSPAPLPHEGVSDLEASAGRRLQLDAVQAMLDLELHRSPSPPSQEEAAALVTSLHAKHTAVPLPSAAAAEAGARLGSFGHLASYGGHYYAYLYARSVAARVWRGAGFAHDALGGAAGRAWCAEVLHHGGSRDPRQLLQSLLRSSPCGETSGAASGAVAAEGSAASSEEVVEQALLRLVRLETEA